MSAGRGTGTTGTAGTAGTTGDATASGVLLGAPVPTTGRGAAIRGDVTGSPPPDDDEVAAIVAAVQALLQRQEAPRAPEPRSGWRFAGRWWR